MNCLICGCESIDDDRIPYTDVHLTFTTQADWEFYGVKEGAVGHKMFVRHGNTRIPADFHFKDMDRTGFGGLLMVSSTMGDLIAYDLACPVECSPTVRLTVPADELFAECPECHSTYEIFTNYGYPRSGPAAKRRYALKRYRVSFGGPNNYIIVTH